MSEQPDRLWLLLPSGERPSAEQRAGARAQHWVSATETHPGGTLLVLGESAEVIRDENFPGEYITRLELGRAPEFRAALDRLRALDDPFGEYPRWDSTLSHALASIGAAWMRQAHQMLSTRERGARVKVPAPTGEDSPEARERCMLELLAFLRGSVRDSFDSTVLIGCGGSGELLAEMLEGMASGRWSPGYTIRNQMSEALERMLGSNALAQGRAIGAISQWPAGQLAQLCRSIGHSYVISPETRAQVVRAGCANPELTESDLAALGFLVKERAEAELVLEHPRCSAAAMFAVAQGVRGECSDIPEIALARAAMVRGRSNEEWIATIEALRSAAAAHGLGVRELAGIHKQLGNEIEALSSSELAALSISALRESRVPQA